MTSKANLRVVDNRDTKRAVQVQGTVALNTSAKKTHDGVIRDRGKDNDAVPY